MPKFIGGKARFRWLTGDVNYLDYGGKWISQRFHNGDWSWYFVAQLINWEDAVGEREAKEQGSTYNLCLSIVSPQAARPEWENAADSYGMELDEFRKLPPVAKADVLHGYGASAFQWQDNGNNFRHLWKAMHTEANEYAMWFGFKMDKPVNAIGSTGWDAVTGNITAGLYRYSENDSPEKQLVRKISGLPATLAEAKASQ